MAPRPRKAASVEEKGPSSKTMHQTGNKAISKQKGEATKKQTTANLQRAVKGALRESTSAAANVPDGLGNLAPRPRGVNQLTPACLVESARFLEFDEVHTCEFVSRAWSVILQRNRRRFSRLISEECSIVCAAYGLCGSQMLHNINLITESGERHRLQMIGEPTCEVLCRRKIDKDTRKLLIGEPILTEEFASNFINLSMNLPATDPIPRRPLRSCVGDRQRAQNYRLLCNQLIQRNTLVQVLHWFKVNIRPFNKLLWEATTPEHEGDDLPIQCGSMNVLFVEPLQQLEWMIELCSKHVKADEGLCWCIAWGAVNEEAVVGRLTDFILHGNGAKLVKEFTLKNRHAEYYFLATLIEKFEALTEASTPITRVCLPSFICVEEERENLEQHKVATGREGSGELHTYQVKNEAAHSMMEITITMKLRVVTNRCELKVNFLPLNV